MTPQFQHDCTTCKFLGHSTTKQPADLYYHPGQYETIIARWSSEPSDYSSGLCFKDSLPELGEAYQLAKNGGI